MGVTRGGSSLPTSYMLCVCVYTCLCWCLYMCMCMLINWGKRIWLTKGANPGAEKTWHCRDRKKQGQRVRASDGELRSSIPPSTFSLFSHFSLFLLPQCPPLFQRVHLLTYIHHTYITHIHVYIHTSTEEKCREIGR